jgi:hypothetical protein
MSFNLDHAGFALTRAERLARDAEVLVPQSHPAHQKIGQLLSLISDALEDLKS